jgi:hypothetical protein
VNAKEIKTSFGCVTALLAVCADGQKLPPLIVFKGKPGGSIASESKNYPIGAHFIVQENAWTDERVMLHWVTTVLKPYIEKAPPGIVPYLLLDKYKCHYQGSVANAIEELGVEWDIIPGGCTGLVQPIDVGIGKPWKNRMRYKVEDWMMDRDTQRVKPHEVRALVAKWSVECWSDLPVDVVFNSWRHAPFSYFPGEETRLTTYEYSDYSFSDDDDDDDEEEEDSDRSFEGSITNI